MGFAKMPLKINFFNLSLKKVEISKSFLLGKAVHMDLKSLAGLFTFDPDGCNQQHCNTSSGKNPKRHDKNSFDMLF